MAHQKMDGGEVFGRIVLTPSRSQAALSNRVSCSNQS
jgi:hypothetical protein